MDTKVCSIDGCLRQARGKGYCAAHYSKLRKYGDPLAGRTNDGGACRADGCDVAIHARGLCRLHYERAKKHGDPSIVRRVRGCGVNGCERRHKANGWCEFHNDRNRRKGDPLAGDPKRLSPRSLTTCSVQGCDNKAVAKHLCNNHRAKFKKFGDPLAGWTQDGRSKEWRPDSNGYIQKWDPKHKCAGSNGFVYQHRLVIAEVIGRPLRSHESAHHKNGDRADNRLSNLELWVKGQPAGQRVQDKVAWAREILREYGDLVDRMR